MKFIISNLFAVVASVALARFCQSILPAFICFSILMSQIWSRQAAADLIAEMIARKHLGN